MSRSDLVAKRLAYIERQKKLHADTVNVDVRARRPEGSGPANRHGMPKLPVGQHAVPNWPVLDLGDVPDVPLTAWRLEIAGEVHNPTTLTWDDFLALPQVDDVSDFHCVTTWSRFDNHWRGVRMRDLAELVVPTDEAHFVSFTGSDKEPNTGVPYTTTLPLARATEADVLLVHTWEGRPLPREHGGPVRVITPKLYAWKGTKWVRRIEFLEKDRRGFWEVRGYSNTAEPWLNDRYS
jgi:DMSO/TMAO reductase YedYZ molybdopterin-dependent catalytic subunit